MRPEIRSNSERSMHILADTTMACRSRAAVDGLSAGEFRNDGAGVCRGVCVCPMLTPSPSPPLSSTRHHYHHHPASTHTKSHLPEPTKSSSAAAPPPILNALAVAYPRITPHDGAFLPQISALQLQPHLKSTAGPQHRHTGCIDKGPA